MKKFNMRIPEDLREKAEAETELSMIVGDEAQAPKDMKMVSVLPSKEGYAMLGDFVDRNLVTDRESKAALEDSSIDGDQSIDLDSEGSDDEITAAAKKRMQKRYKHLMDEDARSYVVLETAVVGNKEGRLVVSTNSDALNEVQEVRMMKMHAEDKESDFDLWFDNEFDFDEKVKSEERVKEVGAAAEC